MSFHHTKPVHSGYASPVVVGGPGQPPVVGHGHPSHTVVVGGPAQPIYGQTVNVGAPGYHQTHHHGGPVYIPPTSHYGHHTQISAIAPAYLSQLIATQGHGILFIDCQDHNGQFGNPTHHVKLNHANVIHIPASGLHHQKLHHHHHHVDLKKAGKSIGKYLKKSGRDYEYRIWKDRSQFNSIILYDWSSTWSNRSSHLNAVCDAVKQKKDKHGHTQIQILDGGLQSLQHVNPQLLTSPPGYAVPPYVTPPVIHHPPYNPTAAGVAQPAHPINPGGAGWAVPQYRNPY